MVKLGVDSSLGGICTSGVVRGVGSLCLKGEWRREKLFLFVVTRKTMGCKATAFSCLSARRVSEHVLRSAAGSQTIVIPGGRIDVEMVG